MLIPTEEIAGVRKKMIENRLDYIDNMILNAIKENPSFDDIKLSSLLHCPRILLLSRLEKLIKYGYILYDGKNFSLTEDGKDELIPLSFTDSSQAMREFELSRNFDWRALYIPQINWEDK